VRLDHLLSKELPTLIVAGFAGGWVFRCHALAERASGWLLMGGTLTKELRFVAGV
jgi:hypothetical protein